MCCIQCNKDVVECECPDMDERMKRLVGSKFLDPRMIVRIIEERKARKANIQIAPEKN